MKKCLFIASLLFATNAFSQCKCIDGFFGSSTEEPFYSTTIGKHQIVFCGYGDKTEQTSFSTSGFDIIDCSNTTILKSYDEFWQDSIQIHENYIEVFRMERFPILNQTEWQPTPTVRHSIKEVNGELVLNESFSPPHYFFKDEYLAFIKNKMKNHKDDKDSTVFEDYRLKLLFLKALNNKDDIDEFLQFTSIVSYLGVFHDYYKEYLEMEIYPIAQ